VTYVSQQSAVRYTGGGDLVREGVFDECRFGGQSDGAPVRSPATLLIKFASASACRPSVLFAQSNSGEVDFTDARNAPCQVQRCDLMKEVT